MLDTRGDDHHAPAEARRAQADEEEKEGFACRVHARTLAHRPPCAVTADTKERQLATSSQELADELLAAAERLKQYALT